MCGISGIIYKDKAELNKEEIKKMSDLIIHRGPDDSGYYIKENVALGHRRLAVLDLSRDGMQPMIYNNKYAIVYNGEIYNYNDLKQELKNYGYCFKTKTDTEVILAAYDKWGNKCVDYFVGMWAFAIYDTDNCIMFCSRDRFGIKPFYYCNFENKFAFGSEIKQFTVLEGWEAKANKKRVIDFLMFEMFDHTDETLFDGVFQLGGGHNLIYDTRKKTYNVYKYYSLENGVKDYKEVFSGTSKQFYRMFEESIKIHLQSDVKVGSCLSGGLDSSSIVCVINKLLGKESTNVKQETVSSCFNNSKYDEQEYIDEVVNYTGVVSHKVFPKFTDLFKELDKITWHQDEPFGSTSIFAQWNVFKTARENGITVMLDGQGADEQLAGYDGFYGIILSQYLRKLQLSSFFREAVALKKIYGYSIFNIIKSSGKFLIPNSLKALIKKTSGKGVESWVKTDRKYYSEYLKELYGSNIKTLTQYSINQLIYSSLPKLLHYEDRDSMAHSIESRVPFLDHRLVEYVLSIPVDNKIRNGVTKYILRDSMIGTVPGKILKRKDKMGFVTPEEVWIRQNNDLFRDELLKACNVLESIIDKEKVLKWYDKLIKSNHKIDFTLWRIISLGKWAQVFNVNI